MKLLRVVEDAFPIAEMSCTAFEYEGSSGKRVTIGLWHDGMVVVYPFSIEGAADGEIIKGDLLSGHVRAMELLGE